jgi:hypothetical protein
MLPSAVLKTVNHRSRLLLVKGKAINDLVTMNVRPPDLARLNRTEIRLLEAVNNARFRHERDKSGPEEYDEALRKYNQFARRKPLLRNA